MKIHKERVCERYGLDPNESYSLAKFVIGFWFLGLDKPNAFCLRHRRIWCVFLV